MSLSKDELLTLVRKGARNMSRQEKLRLTVLLSLPAMIAQLSSVAMQIIDAAMLGHLGTKESASVGLVSTTIWLFGGLCSAFAAGFSVQVAHYVGAENLQKARNIIRQGIFSGLVFSLLLSSIGIAIAPSLPHWLGASEEICADATKYFTIVAIALPVLEINTLAAGSLRCSGNIKVPSLLNAMMCILDIIFNYLFIFIFNMGTAGAAYGTFAAYIITATLKLGEMPERFVKYSDVLMWPWRIAWFVAMWGAIGLAAPAVIEGASDKTKFLAFIALAAATVYVMVAKLNTDADKTMTDVAGWMFIGISQALIALNHWWLLFVWLLPIAAVIIWRVKWWRTLISLSSIIALFIYAFI